MQQAQTGGAAFSPPRQGRRTSRKSTGGCSRLPTAHRSPPRKRRIEGVPRESGNLISDLATRQRFDGMFKADGRILAWLGLGNRGLENAHADADLVVTVAAIVALEVRFPELLEEWEFMVSKAKEAVEKLYSEGEREAVALAVRAALGM